MIRIKLRLLLEEKAFSEKRKITLNEVSEKTGISRPTLNRIVNVIGYNTNTDTINLLCKYFECRLCELCEYIDDSEKKTE